MVFNNSHCIIFLLVTIIIYPEICYGQEANSLYTRATYYGSPDCYGTPSGACGFGEYGRKIYDGKVSGVSRLYRNGTGCGACYQVRCKVPGHCTDEGTKIVVTDHGEGDHTDFILSVRAYSDMATSGMANHLLAYGVVDVEYRRVPCTYYGYNLMIKVHEHSRFCNYLAIVPIYQSGAFDIEAVEVWQADCKEWRGMRKAYGAVWDMPNPPKGSLTFRVQVSLNGEAAKWVQLADVLPDEWKAGIAYDTYLMLD